MNNWTTTFLASTYPDLKLTRFPESTVRTHCNKVCAEVIHQRGLDQQARLLGRNNNNNNNNNNADDEDDDEEEEEEEEEEEVEEDTPPNVSTHSTPNRRPRMSTSSRASSRRGSRHVDEDDISELADRFSMHAQIPSVIDDTTTVTIEIDGEKIECAAWQDPIHKAVFIHTDPYGETVNVQLVGVETVGGLVSADIKYSFVEEGGDHIVLVKEQSGLGK